MTPAEAVQVIRSVRAIRGAAEDSVFARRLEVAFCRQLWLELVPGSPEIGPLLAVFCGKPREDLQTVCLGIIRGRPAG